MLSAGIFSAFAARMAVRRRGLPSGSPPPPLAAMVISLIRRVKILPRFASVAPFLCLIVAHLEWPDISLLLHLLEVSSAQTTSARRLRFYQSRRHFCSSTLQRHTHCRRS